MRKPLTAGMAAAIVGLALTAPVAAGNERLLTLYSPKIDSLPYVHDTHHVALSADGSAAPAKPGYILGFKEMALVDSKDPNAKPLPIAKMMVHHLLYFAPGRVDQGAGSCWQGAGFIGGRGEEHPLGRTQVALPRSARKVYGINNREADGSAPDWRLTAPHLANGMSYDVPGGGRKGSNFVQSSDWTAPVNGRMLVASSHQHGGGKYETLDSRTCKRRLFKAPVYHGPPDHPYNTIRPIRHEPGPIGTGAYATGKGIPIAEGEVCGGPPCMTTTTCMWRRWASGPPGSWRTTRSGAAGGCRTTSSRSTDRGASTGRPTTTSSCHNCPSRAARSCPFDGNPLAIGDDFFRPGRITAKAGESVTWRFGGNRPHSVTVANGPRGFSSIYWGRTRGTYTVTPRVKGTYRLVCLVHPTTMAQTLEVK